MQYNDLARLMNFDILFPLGFGLVIFALLKRERGQQRRFLEQHALNRNGYLGGNFLQGPRLVFPVGGTEAAIYLKSGSKNSPPQTALTCALNSSADYRLMLSRESALGNFAKRMGLKDLSLNSKAFDEFFIVSGNNEPVIRNILNPAAQAALLRIKDLNPDLRVNSESFHLSVPRKIREDQELDSFIDNGLVVLKNALAQS